MHCFTFKKSNIFQLKLNVVGVSIVGNPSVDSCTMYVLNETDWDHGNYKTWVSDPTRNMTQCQYGWDYDIDIYKSTIVTQVIYSTSLKKTG